jgi:signal transduction histidine kinase
LQQRKPVLLIETGFGNKYILADSMIFPLGRNAIFQHSDIPKKTTQRLHQIVKTFRRLLPLSPLWKNVEVPYQTPHTTMMYLYLLPQLLLRSLARCVQKNYLMLGTMLGLVLLPALFVVSLRAEEEAISTRATFIAEPANPLADSLRAAITTAATDSARVDALNTLARALRLTKFSEAIRRASEALAISERIGYTDGAARAHYNIGCANTRMGAYAQALESHITALLLYEKTGNRLGAAYCYIDMGNVSMYREEFAKNKEYLFKALPILVQTQNKEGISICTNNLGVVYEKIQMYDSSLYWHGQSLAVKLQRADSAGVAYSYFNLGAIYFLQGNYTKALEYEQQSLRIREPLGNSYSLGESYYLLGKIYAALGKDAESLRYLRQAAEVAQTIGAPQVLKDVYDGIALRFVTQKAFDSAYFYRMLNVHLTDSLKSVGSTKRIAEMQSRLTITEQQHRIEVLGQEQERQRLQFLAVIVVMLLLVALALSLGLFIRRKQRDNTLLQEQNDHILRQQTILEQQAADIELANSELNEKNFALERQQDILEEQAGEIEIANTALQEQNVVLERLNEQKSEFLAIASHDLKNPLSSIVMSASMVKRYIDKLTTPEIIGQMDSLERTATRMHDIILNILDAQATEDGHIALHLGDVNVVQTTSDVAGDYTFRAESKQIRLILELPEHPVLVRTDEAIFRQILDNLVSNALKYSPTGKRVWIGVLRHERTVRVFVKDEGQGLTDDDKTKLFGRFTKLSARPTAGEHSSGLGLSIVKTLVETLGGTIWCESEYGRGATFVVEIPRLL